MTNMCDQLRSLYERDISSEETGITVERISEIFNSQPLAKYISQCTVISENYGMFKDGSFFFGLNTELEDSNRQIIQRWIEKANTDTAQLGAETRTWAKAVLENPLKLLVPLAETCIREWLNCDGEPFELYWRFSFSWQCVVSVSILEIV
jgi:hypothetical protein